MLANSRPRIKFISLLEKRWSYFSEKLNKKVFGQLRFDDLELLRPDVKAALQNLKFDRLTHIQSVAFDSIQNFGKTCILAETGSGKTLSYILPIINELYNEIQQNGDQARDATKPRGALIFTSSKELSAQIFVDIKKIDKINKLKVSRLGPISQMSTYVKNMVH
jgi:superfamily II DNA/RNA helicase